MTRRFLLGLSALLIAACGGSSDDGSAGAKAPTETVAKKAKKKNKGVQPAVVANPTMSSAAIPVVPRPEGLPPDDPLLGSVLVINGEVIPHEVIKRLITLHEGVEQLYLARLEIYIEEELAHQLAAGRTPFDVEVVQAEAEALAVEAEEGIRAEYDSELGLDDLMPTGRRGFVDQQTVTNKFLKVFVPDDPGDMPAIALEALADNEQGGHLLEYLKTSDASREEGQKRPREPMVDSSLIQEIGGYLERTAEMEIEGLPPSIAMRVNGVDILVDDIWAQLDGIVSPVEVHKAKQWLTSMTLLEKVLREEGYWLSKEKADELYEAHVGPYRGSIFDLERMAVAIKKHPSAEAYREFRHVYDSFQNKIREEMDADSLREFANRRTRLLVGQAVVDCDVILISAYDFQKRAWNPGGWKESEKKVREVLRQLVQDRRPWNEVLEENSDFFDGPQMAPDAAMYRDKGRLRGKQRNVLMSILGESENSHFLNGTTITDYIFFEQEVGTVSNPIRGPYGWYIPKLIRRGPAPDRVDVDDELMITMAEQDYTILRLATYARQLLQENQVYGLQ